MDSNWSDNNDDDHITPEDNAESSDEKIANAHEALPTDKKPSVKRKEIKGNEKIEVNTTGQKRDNFVIDDQKRIVCLKCMKSYSTQKIFRRHYLLCV